MGKMGLLVLLASLSMNVWAADENSEGQSTMKIEDAADQKNKVEGNLDEEITNAKLRAETGSKSKWSGSFTANYNGGSLQKPMSKNRPNPTRDPIAPKTAMQGDLGVRYRMDKNQSLKAGTGYSLEQPFHEAKRGQINNPQISYNYAGKVGGVQTSFDGLVSFSTNSDEVEIGQRGLVDVSQTVIYDFGGSKLSVGLLAGVTYTDYSKRDEVVQPKGQGAAPAEAFQEDYTLAAYPFAEYAISDLIQLRTVFRPWIFSHARAAETWTFNRRPWTQSFGVGFAVTRDIYLYPNFQWDVETWRANDYSFAAKPVASQSTVGLSATINVF